MSAHSCEACGAEWPTAKGAEHCAEADYNAAEDRRAGMADDTDYVAGEHWDEDFE